MNREKIISILNEYRSELEALGISHLRLFGSVARNEATLNSDIDLVVEFQPKARIGFAIVSIHKRLEEILGCKVDMLRAPVEKSILREKIEEEGVYAF